ncbi:RHS repeat domain-containing protein [Flavobacterium aquiphilum]|uniref:RHS repeat domain-containing protein n=1 Tax=Flavobacterium aquiphilum TaxID=3003261 RepID=UPI00247FC0BE|nr:RHS repeat domain-containing protein [Flavobacterium aquiphilum]
MKIKLTLSLIILISFFCYSQDLPKIIRPTPEAANLTRYADVPVSLYTGKPQIDFPLYTLKCGSLELPISLSYYASGIKVEDYPTWAGIGWALNAGGVITKISKDNGTHLSYDLPVSGTFNEKTNALLTFAGPHAVTDVIYNFNFLQYSGTFQMGKNGPVFRKHTNLKIEIVDIASITMTDDNGIKYYFELKGSLYGIQTDYYLTKIESADKFHTIYLEYILGDKYGKPPHNSVFYTIYPGVSYVKASSENYEIKHSGLLLSKIYTSNNDSVEFIKKDIAQPGSENSVFHHRQALDYIDVYNHSHKIQSFHFKTNNIQTIKPKTGPYSDQFPVSNWDNKAMDYRLYLDGFDKIDAAGQIVESYGFDYYGRTVDGKDSLPSQYSLAQDLDGYYNGQDSNTSLVPPLNESLRPDESDLWDKNSYNDNFVVNVNIPGANRSPDINYMKLGTLKTIKYPTGGSANFYYSQVDNPLNSNPLCGLKIDKIEYLNSNGSLQKKKQYVYEYPVLSHPISSNWHYTLKYSDYGLMTPFPTECEVNDGSNYCADYNSSYSWIWAIELSPDPVYSQLDEGPMIGYGLVKEFEQGNGHIDYQFSTDGAYDEEARDHYFEISRYDGFNTYTLFTKNAWPLGPFETNNWKMGTLLNKATYNENGTIKQDIQYHYSYEILDRIPGINLFGAPKISATRQYLDHAIFYYLDFAYLSTWERLDSVTETMDGITKETNYNYDGHKQVSQITTTKSNGDILTTNFTHPYDYPSSTVYSNMVARNILAPVIEKTETTSLNQTKLEKTNYSFWNPDSGINNLNMITANNVTNYIYPLSVEVKKGQNPIETRLNYNSYDNKGNISSISKTNDVETIYIWGYDSQYPIAKIENASYSQVSSQVANLQSKSNLDNDRNVDIINSNGTINYQGNEGALRSALANLRNSLPNAMVTTYTYDPLIGVTSITDPKGYTTYYQYDNFNRLKQVIDAQGNILSENQYNYKQ